MLMNGKKLEGPSEEIVVIPRTTGDLVFKARTVLAEEYEDLKKLCPVPAPPSIMKPGGETSLEIEDEGYLKDLDEWATKKTAFMFIRSIDATDDLVWETVEAGKPETWANYRDELRAANFSEMEMVALVHAVSDANGMNETKLTEAKKRFLATQEVEREEQNSQTSEQ